MNKNAIYIHVPWCRRRCPYCNFYLVIGQPDKRFTEGIISEWHNRAPLWHQEKASSLYFGGGTPSLLAPEQISFLINFLINKGALEKDAEITLEANPEDINNIFVEKIKNTGINRISLGTQSFADKTLKTLGRMHNAAQAYNSIELLQKYFTNISVDLIIGVPGEDLTSLEKNLQELNKQNIKHISAYLLTIEEKTNFAKRVSTCEESQVESYTLVQSQLKSLGYEQYDISSYARPGYMSRHNQVYWSLGTYMGLGPGAHSMLLLNTGAVERSHNEAELSQWLIKPYLPSYYEKDYLSPEQALREALAFGLRNMQLGINPLLLAQKHKTPLFTSWESIVSKFNNYGWLSSKPDGHIVITSAGALFADAIMREIVCA